MTAGPLVALAEYEAYLADPVIAAERARLEAALRGTHNRQGYTQREWVASGKRASTWAGAESTVTRYRRYLRCGVWGDPEWQEVAS